MIITSNKLISQEGKVCLFSAYERYIMAITIINNGHNHFWISVSCVVIG